MARGATKVAKETKVRAEQRQDEYAAYLQVRQEALEEQRARGWTSGLDWWVPRMRADQERRKQYDRLHDQLTKRAGETP